MKKLLLHALLLLPLSFYVSCDQDEYLDDRWNSRESYSLSRVTRSGDIEPEPIRMIYIYSGHEEETESIVEDSAIINFDISWPSGFSYENIKLTVDTSFVTRGNWKFKDVYITNSFVSTDRAGFTCVGKAVYNDSCRTILIHKYITVDVQSEMRVTTSN